MRCKLNAIDVYLISMQICMCTCNNKLGLKVWGWENERIGRSEPNLRSSVKLTREKAPKKPVQPPTSITYSIHNREWNILATCCAESYPFVSFHHLQSTRTPARYSLCLDYTEKILSGSSNLEEPKITLDCLWSNQRRNIQHGSNGRDTSF